MRQDPLELGDLLLQLLLARLGLFGDALEPPLDVIAVGDQQLEPQRLEIVGGIARAGEAVEDNEERVHLAADSRAAPARCRAPRRLESRRA